MTVSPTTSFSYSAADLRTSTSRTTGVHCHTLPRSAMAIAATHLLASQHRVKVVVCIAVHVRDKRRAAFSLCGQCETQLACRCSLTATTVREIMNEQLNNHAHDFVVGITIEQS